MPTQVNLGDISNTLVLGNGDYVITGADGDNTLTLGNGNDQLTLGNGNNTLTLGGGTDEITAGSGNNTITTTGVGADAIALTGGNNTVSVGDGPDVVTAGDGLNTVTTGDGNDTVDLGNGFDQVTTGNGNSTITVGNGAGDTIFIGTGSNAITIGTGSADIVHTGSGNNTLSVTAAAVGADTIMGGLTSGDGTGNKLVLTSAGSIDPAGVTGFATYQLANGAASSLALKDANFARLPGHSITVLAGNSGDTVDASAVTAGNAVTIDGGAGNDTFITGAGTTNITGGGGTDKVVFSDPLADYGVSDVGSSVLVTDTTSNITDTLTGITTLQFADQSVPGCYCTGTRIATDRGEVPVEELRVGDRVVSALGGMAAVIWLGHRRVDCRRHPKPQDVWPVRVAAGAFTANRPRRDLWLSPDHAVYVDGVLIPIRYLVNDATIVQQPMDDVTYWHVELPAHDVLFAEGLAAESYLDTGNRGAFANGGGAAILHPDFALRVWEAEACAKLVVEGAKLVAVRSRLLKRAEALGHRTTPHAGLHLLVGGRIVRPTVKGRVHRFQLAGAAGDIRLVSRSAVPVAVNADSDDHRRLGVAVARILLDGRVIPLADARLGAGWHALEPDGAGGGWRWTDGDAGLDVPGTCVLEVEVVITGRYWLAQGRTDARAA